MNDTNIIYNRKKVIFSCYNILHKCILYNINGYKKIFTFILIDQFACQLYTIVVRSKQYLQSLKRCFEKKYLPDFVKITCQIQIFFKQSFDIYRLLCMAAIWYIDYSTQILAVPTWYWRERDVPKISDRYLKNCSTGSHIYR